MASTAEIVHETVAIDDLTPHPRNYQGHPEDQRDHIAKSLQDHGQYRNVVIARDGTILAGHGVVEAAQSIGWETVDVVRMNLDPDDPAAIKILVGDNEIGRLAEVNDRLLTEHLRFLAEQDALLGTGFDDSTLATLVFVTRPESEIGTFDEAAQWVGLPDDYVGSGTNILLVLHFEKSGDRDALIEQLELTIAKRTRQTWSAWWPPRDRNDLSSLRFDA